MLTPSKHAKWDLQAFQNRLIFPFEPERQHVVDYGARTLPVLRHFFTFALGLSATLLGALACATMAPAVQSRSPTAPPAPTSAPLHTQVGLTSFQTQEHGQPFDYTITAQTPRLTGSDDARVQAFNGRMAAIVGDQVATFKQSLTAMPLTPVTAPSSFSVRYALLSTSGAIFSIKFEMEGYVTGAAHPYHLSRTANFDLEAGEELMLADLFVPGSKYLETIFAYCITQLETRAIAFDASNPGASPTLENYRNWNITADGLLITFDEYQVAAYAAGPQTVQIPYPALHAVIRDPGPLSGYLH
jgi:hypothetical protein